MELKLIVLFAHWCPKCSMMMPIVDEIEEYYQERMEVIRIDIEQEQEIAKEYQVEIVPTFLIKKNDKELMRMAGMIGENVLKKRIQSVIDS